MVTIQLGTEEITIIGYTVEGNGPWARLVRNDARMMRIEAADPFPALAVAKAMVEKYGAVITAQAAPVTNEGLVY